VQILIKPTYEELSDEAARLVAAAIHAKPQLILSLPTGRTSRGMYRELIRLYRDRKVDFSRVSFFSLDEYVSLRTDHPQSLRAFLWREFLNYVNARKVNVYTPDEGYEARIRKAGGLDLVVLGIGTNGHIAFNEPGSPLDSRTRVVTLSDTTIDAIREKFSPQELPRQAITIGLATIMDAGRVLLLASGQAKAEALRRVLQDEISPAVPASILRQHSNATVLADEEAASRYQTPDESPATHPDRQRA
jgi:glucosamine-6-phosphate deaminase